MVARTENILVIEGIGQGYIVQSCTFTPGSRKGTVVGSYRSRSKAPQRWCNERRTRTSTRFLPSKSHHCPEQEQDGACSLLLKLLTQFLPNLLPGFCTAHVCLCLSPWSHRPLQQTLHWDDITATEIVVRVWESLTQCALDKLALWHTELHKHPKRLWWFDQFSSNTSGKSTWATT